MTDTAVSAVVMGLINIAGMVVGFLTLWVKLKYGVEEPAKLAKEAADVAVTKAKAVEDKLDQNTSLTSEVKEAANRAAQHAEGCDEERTRILSSVADHAASLAVHDGRITALEVQMAALKLSVDGVTKSVDSVEKSVTSSRHEMRGHLQTLIGKLDLIAMGRGRDDDKQPRGQ